MGDQFKLPGGVAGKFWAVAFVLMIGLIVMFGMTTVLSLFSFMFKNTALLYIISGVVGLWFIFKIIS